MHEILLTVRQALIGVKVIVVDMAMAQVTISGAGKVIECQICHAHSQRLSTYCTLISGSHVGERPLQANVYKVA